MKKFIIVLYFLGIHASSHAYESDQFTVPNEELADVGEDISSFIYSRVNFAVEKINSDLSILPQKIEETQIALESLEAKEKPLLSRELKNKLATYKERYKSIQSPEGVVQAVYKEIGPKLSWEDQRDGVFGLPLSYIPYPENLKDGKRITYVPKTTQNIYALAGFHRIISSSFFVFCSSLKMFDVYLGVDKLGHMFNQGYEYYTLLSKKLREGKSEKEALKDVIDWGRSTENGIFGTLVNGIYANADLAANYSGLLFYKNLLEKTHIAGEIRHPVLIINSDKTVSLNPEVTFTGLTFLAPYISKHLNEAYNPSRFEKLVRIMVKKAIVKRCDNVKRFYEIIDKSEIKNITQDLYTFYGEDYGHRDDDLIKVDEVCFP